METGVLVTGGMSVESGVALSGAIVEVLTVCGEQRIPESVMLKALDVLRGAATPPPTTIASCTFGDSKDVTVDNP